MNFSELKSHTDLQEKIASLDTAFVLLYKKGSEISECSLKSISRAADGNKDVHIFMVDVNEVRDVHTQYQITTVPTLLEFEKGTFVKTFKGCNDVDYYNSIFENNMYKTKAAEEGKTLKRVTVYTTPTCSWCTTLKNHLKKHGVRFSEIDVSKDSKSAEEMTRRSGQRGVPQTDINGKMIIGFDKSKINRLLEIND